MLDLIKSILGLKTKPSAVEPVAAKPSRKVAPKRQTTKQTTSLVDGNIITLPDDGRYDLLMVGTSHYYDTIKELYGETKGNYHNRARLISEIDNSHDKNAVRVEIDGKQVGFLSSADATKYRRKLSQWGHVNATCECRVKISTKSAENDRVLFFVRLDVDIDEIGK